MIKSGIVSVTFREKTPRELIDISIKGQLQAVEWGSDVHVPVGNLSLAREIRDMTISSGLEVASYGSYYFAGMDKEEFSPYLETAIELGAPNIRIWAGQQPSASTDLSYRQRVTEEVYRISEDAAKAGVTISAEYHANSLTDTIDAALQFLQMGKSDNLYSYWQQPDEVSSENQYPEMLRLFDTGKITNIHVYAKYTEDGQRRLLEEDLAAWRRFLPVFKSEDKRHYALLEFVKDNSDEVFLKDCETLNSLIAE